MAKDSQVGALGARCPRQESSGPCRTTEDKRGERGQGHSPGHLRGQVSRLFSELSAHRGRQADMQSGQEGQDAVGMGCQHWGVARGRILQCHCSVLTVGLTPASSALFPQTSLSGRTSQGHKDRRVLLRATSQVDRSHPAKLLQLTPFSPSTSQPKQYLPREYWEKLVAEAGFGPSLNLKSCSWPCVLLMRLGMHMLELMVKAIKVPRNILNRRLESKPIPVLYHVYSFYSNWQVSLILGALGLCRIPLLQNQTLARPFSVLAAIVAQGCFEEPLIQCGCSPYLA